MYCRFSENSDYDCGCKNKQERRICKNEERLRVLSERTDGAAFHTEKKGYNTYVSIAYSHMHTDAHTGILSYDVIRNHLSSSFKEAILSCKC